ncbi:MAG: bifunctional [glutamate--ammonia ligase]-adenylyl-L-tyrosine phosphorylase/[glutamate--ammonia-ligase] adenylyltransferase, partial [Isosphaeraceae bacterium]
DLAEAIVGQVARDHWNRRVSRFGTPRSPGGERARWAILGLGKFGGRELNYHSDLDLVFVLEADGMTAGGGESIPNDQFLTELVRRLLKSLGGSTTTAPLYAVDTRLRPHGASGPLVVTLDQFREYFREEAQPWERLALCRGRVVHANGGFAGPVNDAVREALSATVDPASFAQDVLNMRRRLEENPHRNELKRGYGGLSDIEFLVHYLQVVHGRTRPEILRPNLWNALDALRRAEFLTPAEHSVLREAYDFWRTVESRLRIVYSRSGVDLPECPEELARLARRLNYDQADPTACAGAFRRDADRLTARCRALFQQVVGRPADASP